MYCQQWVQLLTSDLETRAWLYEGHQRYAQAALLLSQSGSLTPPTIHAPLAEAQLHGKSNKQFLASDSLDTM